MKNTVNIQIWKTSKVVEFGVTNRTGTPFLFVEDFVRLAEFCKLNKMSPSLEKTGIDYGSLSVQCDESHQALPTLMGMLAELGWLPVPRVITSETPEFGFFPLRVIRSFDSKYLNFASHFLLDQWGTISVRVPLNRDDNGEFSGFSACGMSGRWKYDFLEVEGLRHFAVSEVGKEILEKGELRGILFREIEWDFPKKVKRPFYIVDADRIMPPCLLPIVEEASYLKTRWYIDGPYDPPILQFSNSLKGSIGDLDIALTAESLRESPKTLLGGSRDRSLIISRKFREVLKSAKIKHQAYPVKWVDGKCAVDEIPPFIQFPSVHEWLNTTSAV